MKLSEVSIELPLALALWSALTNKSLPKALISFGELSLAGEVRGGVGFPPDKREKAAKELGFKRSIVPKVGSRSPPLVQHACSTVKEALDLMNSMK